MHVRSMFVCCVKTKEMEPSNQSFTSSDTGTEEVPLSVTYLNMVYLPIVATVVITPA